MATRTDKFLSAEQLGVAPKEYDALVEVLDQLESGEIVYDPTMDTEKRGFNFATVALHHKRGVCACIVGWAKLLGGNSTFESTVEKLAFDPVRKILPVSSKLEALIDLFFGPVARKWKLESITPQQAAEAIRNFLTVGAPKWDEIVPDWQKEP